jgi:putative transposase
VKKFYRRRLPHLSLEGQPVFITWRLEGSLPANRVFPAEITSGQAFALMDAWLDQGFTGPLHLSRPEIADLIVSAVRHGEREMKLYDLHAFVVMSNHVHLLITPWVRLAKITQSLKRYTANESNQIVGLTGRTFWQGESYDHVVRDNKEFARIWRYIENNPVRAGLVKTAEDFRWSSARADWKSAAG